MFMKRPVFLLLFSVFLNYLPARSQTPERGIALPISAQNACDLEFGYNGTSYLSVNYDHMFFLKPERNGPGILLRAGLGDGLSPGYGMVFMAEAAYTTGYLTFAELGTGYSGQAYFGNWQHLPYFTAAFRYRANSGLSVRLFSRLIMNRSEEVPMFGMGASLGFTF
jgi:hypothetical protein